MGKRFVEMVLSAEAGPEEDEDVRGLTGLRGMLPRLPRAEKKLVICCAIFG